MPELAFVPLPSLSGAVALEEVLADGATAELGGEVGGDSLADNLGGRQRGFYKCHKNHLGLDKISVQIKRNGFEHDSVFLPDLLRAAASSQISGILAPPPARSG